MNNDNLPLYSAFLAVAKAGSILKASEQLFVSQPAVSKSIQRLEQNLGTTLFVRTSKGVHLTDEGAMLYTNISNAFEYIDAGEAGIMSRSTLGIGHIRIGCSTTLCKYVLLPFLSIYTAAHPNINISIECQSSKETLSMLKEGAVDIGLVAKPDSQRHFKFFTVGSVHDIFIATPAYMESIESRAGKVNLLLLNRNNLTRQFVDSHIPSSFMNEKNILEIDNMNLLIDFTKAGIGIGCAIKEFVRDELNSNILTEYKAKLPALPKRQVCFAYNANRSPSVHCSDFIDYIETHKHDRSLNILKP